MESYTETRDSNGEPVSVTRGSDSAFIPADPMNRDYQQYEKWLVSGGTPTIINT